MLSSLTVDDEVRQIGRLIACFIFHVDYGKDLEKYLNFYMEARGTFIRLDYVQSALVQVRLYTHKTLKSSVFEFIEFRVYKTFKFFLVCQQTDGCNRVQITVTCEKLFCTCLFRLLLHYHSIHQFTAC